MNTSPMNTIVLKGVFAVMPFTLSQMVYDMSKGTDQCRTKANVSVAGKTYTEEELDYMAAVRAAASCDLPGAFLVELAAKCPPPAEWLDTDEEMPF
jgi:hypothetical protein